MNNREHDLKSRRFEFDEIRRKLRDLNDLKRQLESSLDRLAAPESGTSVAVGGGELEERRSTLQQSLSEISRQIDETKSAMESSREAIEHQELVHNGYNRIPVAVGSRRGRGQVEHIRIVRTQRG